MTSFRKQQLKLENEAGLPKSQREALSSLNNFQTKLDSEVEGQHQDPQEEDSQASKQTNKQVPSNQLKARFKNKEMMAPEEKKYEDDGDTSPNIKT